METVRMFQVNENDLADLERLLPQLGEALFPVLNSRLKTQLRRCRSIISDIRWGYGPPDEGEIIPADGGDVQP